MKWVRITDAAGKPLKITLLTDWDLLYCIPYMLLSFLYRITRMIVYLIFRLMVAPTFALFTRSNASLTWAIVLFPCLIAAASAVTAVAGAFSIADFASALVLFLFGSTLFAKVVTHLFHLEDARFPPAGRLSSREAATVTRMRVEAARLPDSCVRNTLDKSILYIGFLRTMLVFPALVCVVFLSASWLNYALNAYIALLIFNDFEGIEHVSAHSTNGKLLIAQNAPWWARLVELLRRYIVWPLCGWFPDMYFVTHAMHHHVENNGPADWQSTIRHDRTSVLDFAKSVTWLGINLAIPIETLSYLVQRRGLRLFRRLIQGFCIYLLLLALLVIVDPALFLILAADSVLAGFGMYRFVAAWHGFHDPSHAYDIKAANQNLFHYAHHAKPRVHLRDFESLTRVVQEIENPSSVVILRPEFESRRPFWQLQGLLWKKDFVRAADCLVEHNTVTLGDMAEAPFILRQDLVGRGVSAAAMQKLAASFFPSARSQWLKGLDDFLSTVVGAIASRRHAPLTALPAAATASGDQS
jgi:hypothetical protein